MAGEQSVRHDAGAHDGGQQECCAQSFRDQATGQSGAHDGVTTRRMTTAEAGQADWNSTDALTDAGPSFRLIRSNPNRGQHHAVGPRAFDGGANILTRGERSTRRRYQLE